MEYKGTPTRLQNNKFEIYLQDFIQWLKDNYWQLLTFSIAKILIVNIALIMIVLSFVSKFQIMLRKT